MKRKGPSVEPVRPRASNDLRPDTGDALEAAHRGASELTRAQAHALRRCAPLTPAQFKAKRLFSEPGIESPEARSGVSPRPRQD